MKYKLFACDLDETLLNDEHLVPQVNADAVRRAREEFGLKIVPCTGRGYKTTECELKALGLYGLKNEYVLSYNGSCLTENAGYREQFFHALPYETVCKIADAAKDFDVCIEFYTVNMIYIYRLNEDERCRKIGQNAAFTEIFDLDLSFLKDIPVAKVLLEKVDMPYLFSLKPKMLPIVGDICSITFSAGRFMEIITAGIDKGVGLSLLSQKLDIPLSEIMAAGDNYNDIPMLQKVGLSVCPANAVDEVKAVCNYVAKADNNAGAIAEALEKLVFSEE